MSVTRATNSSSIAMRLMATMGIAPRVFDGVLWHGLLTVPPALTAGLLFARTRRPSVGSGWHGQETVPQRCLLPRCVDPVKDALVRKEALLRLVPVLHERRDREQLQVRKLRLVLLKHVGVDRPVIVLRDDLLG